MQLRSSSTLSMEELTLCMEKLNSRKELEKLSFAGGLIGVRVWRDVSRCGVGE